MSEKWPRQDGESDEAYFMRVFRDAEKRYPDLECRLLFFGACDATGLPCLHPFNLREYHGLQGTVLLTEFLESEPPNRRESREYRDCVSSKTRCPVCDTWWPREPVDICGQRDRMLADVLAEAVV